MSSPTGSPLRRLRCQHGGWEEWYRTSFQDKKLGTIVTSVSYCYDFADRLTSTDATTAGGNPVLNTDLSTTGAPATLAYDSHGNTTTLADQTLTYDVVDRHMKTTLSDGTTVTYLRDATGRVVSRVTDAPGTAGDSTIRYSFAGGALFAVLDASNQVLQREIICSSKNVARVGINPNVLLNRVHT